MAADGAATGGEAAFVALLLFLDHQRDCMMAACRLQPGLNATTVTAVSPGWKAGRRGRKAHVVTDQSKRDHSVKYSYREFVWILSLT